MRVMVKFFASALLVLGGCTAHQYAPGPGMSLGQLSPDMAGCRLFARGSDPGHSFSAVGSRRFVATAAAVDAVGSAISSGIRQSADYDDCMLMRGWQVVDKAAPPPATTISPVAVAIPTASPAPIQSDTGVPMPPLLVSSPAIYEPVRKPFGVRANTVDDTLAASLNLNPLRGGVIVLDVNRDGAAWRGGLKPGDVLLSFDEQQVVDINDLRTDLRHISAGNIVLATVWRAGKTVRLKFDF